MTASGGKVDLNSIYGHNELGSPETPYCFEATQRHGRRPQSKTNWHSYMQLNTGDTWLVV
jgi:hypothetical protein